jgi:hypothetical protein
MPAITSYDTLIQAIKDKAEDDGVEFASYVPVAILNAEDRLFRDLDLPELQEDVNGTLTNGVYLLSKPSGYRFAEHLVVFRGTERRVLKKKKESFIQDYWSQPDNLKGTPKYYCDKNLSQFLIAPTPADDYTYVLKFSKEPQKLSTTNSTNYYIEKCQDILFAACMWEMSQFMKAWDQLPVYQQDYTALKDAWNIEAMRYRRDGETVPMSPSGGNTIKHTVQSGA